MYETRTKKSILYIHYLVVKTFLHMMPFSGFIAAKIKITKLNFDAKLKLDFAETTIYHPLNNKTLLCC